MSLAVEIPPGIPSDGTVKAIWVPGGLEVVNNTVALAALTAGVQDISCHVTPDSVGATPSEATSQGRRLCSRQSYTRRGPVSWTLSNLQYIYDVQNPESLSHEAYAALVPGTRGALALRWGVDAFEDVAEDDVFDIWEVELGVRSKQQPEENSELYVVQTPYLVGVYHEDVTIAA